MAAVVSFLVAALILHADKSTEDSLEAAQAATQAAKAQSKGQLVSTSVDAVVSTDSVEKSFSPAMLVWEALLWELVFFEIRLKKQV